MFLRALRTLDLRDPFCSKMASSSWGSTPMPSLFMAAIVRVKLAAEERMVGDGMMWGWATSATSFALEIRLVDLR